MMLNTTYVMPLINQSETMQDIRTDRSFIRLF